MKGDVCFTFVEGISGVIGKSVSFEARHQDTALTGFSVTRQGALFVCLFY